MQVILANPRGFCAGVDRAIEIVERALKLHGAPIYVRHEVVHNKYVVDDLRAKGAVFVEELAEVPQGATVVFSAHGVSQAIRREAQARKLKVFDATCPLVTKVHVEVAKMHDGRREIIMIGHAGHPEVEGTMGQVSGGMYLVESIADVERLEVKNPGNLAFVTQTTLSVDDARAITLALRRRFPGIVGPGRTTSAAPPRIARTRSRRWRRAATSSSWWARRTAPTPTGCAKWRPISACLPTCWTTWQT
jgi:4-hydroxy-3-methylbut-2-enyl diphosphate reductase